VSGDTFVERLVAGQLSSRITELEADLAAERAEVVRLRAAVVILFGGDDIEGETIFPSQPFDERLAIADAHHVLTSEDK